ncbi:MAG: ABC transporter substrate-binding protein [Thermomicrobiales bacterium]|nr:ABC transporter substrate-binding protein [Thermomicrobiales bacterium]
MRTKSLRVVLASLMLALSFAGVSGSATAQDATPPAAPSGDPIIIGAAVHQSDWMSAYDLPPLEGAQLAVDHINSQGGVLGRPLQLIDGDGKTDPATVGNVAIELIDQGAEVLIAPCDFDYGAPVSQVAQEAGIVGISTCASSPLYGSDALGDKQFTVSMWNQTMSAAAAQFAFTDRGWTRAATIIDTSTEYTQSLGEFFVETFQHLGGTVVSEDTYTMGDMQINAQIQRLQGLAEAPDVIFLSANMPDYAMMVRELRAAGFEQPLMGGDAMDTADFYPAVGAELGNNIFISTHSFLGAEVSPQMAEFLDLYQAAHGKAPETAFVVMGWDTVNIIAQAITKAGTTEGAALALAMEELTYDLLSGQLDWADAAGGHAPDKEAFILEVVSGAPTFVTRLRPEWTPAVES